MLPCPEITVSGGLALVAGATALAVASSLWSRRRDAAELAEIAGHLRRGALLVDVRTEREFAGATNHIAGALNIRVTSLPKRCAELGNRARPVVLYCDTGARSGQATAMLKRAGFERPYNLGGLRRARRLPPDVLELLAQRAPTSPPRSSDD